MEDIDERRDFISDYLGGFEFELGASFFDLGMIEEFYIQFDGSIMLINSFYLESLRVVTLDGLTLDGIQGIRTAHIAKFTVEGSGTFLKSPVLDLKNTRCCARLIGKRLVDVLIEDRRFGIGLILDFEGLKLRVDGTIAHSFIVCPAETLKPNQFGREYGFSVKSLGE